MAPQDTDRLAEDMAGLSVTKPHRGRKKGTRSEVTKGSKKIYDTEKKGGTEGTTTKATDQHLTVSTNLPPHKRTGGKSMDKGKFSSVPAAASAFPPSYFNANAPPFQPQQSLKYEPSAYLQPRGGVGVPLRDQPIGPAAWRAQLDMRNSAPQAMTDDHPAVSKTRARTRAQTQQSSQYVQPLPNFALPATITKPAKESRKFLLARPVPSTSYVTQANKHSTTIDKPRPLLVVLDLNGTLLYRKNKGTSFVSRPHLNDFLRYVFNNHHVMVWSSARPDNVGGICDKLFSREQKDKLVAVWARDTMRLPDNLYNEKVQVYKQLSWVWNDKKVQSQNPYAAGIWNQENTVLLDDTIEKAAGEPYNLLQLDEFEARKDQMEVDVLGQVVMYLETLRSERDVSAYMRSKPFKVGAEAEASFDWPSIVNVMQ